MNKKTKTVNRENNLLDKNLNKENTSVMVDIVCYLRATDITNYNVELIRRDVLDMMLSAQERNETVASVIGNYKDFCDDIIANVTKKSLKDKVIEIISTLFLCTAIFGTITLIISEEVINIVKNLLSGRKADLLVAITVGNNLWYLIIMIIATSIVQYICKTALNETKKLSKKALFIKGGFLGLIFSVIILGEVFLSKYIIFSVNIFVGLFVMLLLFLVSKVVEEI